MITMKQLLMKYWKDIAIYGLVASCIAYMHLCNGWTSLGLFWILEFLTFIVFDTTVLLFFAYILSLGYRRIAYSFAFTITMIWTVVNVYYYRFFNQYFNFRDIGEAKNFKDDVVWNSVFSAIQWPDAFLLLAIGLFVFVILKMEPSRMSFLQRVKRLKIYAALPLLMIVFYGTERVLMDAALAIRDYKQQASLLQGWDYIYIHTRNIQHRGLLCGQLYDDAIVSREDKVLTEEEKQFVEQHCKQLCDSATVIEQSADSLPKNIIFILLESALSFPIDTIIDGVEITPNLNALIRESGTYYNGRCNSNRGIGESFDGQFIYHTGLLPLRGKLTSTFVVDNQLKSLPLFLKEQSGIQSATMAIPTGPGMWRQEEMCRLYGYDKLLSAVNAGEKIMGDGGQWLNLNDSTLIDMIINQGSDISSTHPFLYTILTMSMHGPYEEAEYDMDMPTIPTYSLQVNNYLKRYHYTDRQLGRYFKYLESKNIYENSIIIIASDHEAHAKALNMPKEEIGNDNMPLIIAHAGIDIDKCWTGDMNQLDVFTTLLDVLRIGADWRGLGSSVMDKEKYENRLNETTQKVSDLIIESNYWNDNR